MREPKGVIGLQGMEREQFLKSYAKVSKERDLLLCAVLAIRNIKISIPFDAAAAATECIHIAREALAQLIESQRSTDPHVVQAEPEKGVGKED